jgi:hypothetical protein
MDHNDDRQDIYYLARARGTHETQDLTTMYTTTNTLENGFGWLWLFTWDHFIQRVHAIPPYNPRCYGTRNVLKLEVVTNKLHIIRCCTYTIDGFFKVPLVCGVWCSNLGLQEKVKTTRAKYNEAKKKQNGQS